MSTVTVYVPPLPEFLPMVEDARARGSARIERTADGYLVLTADGVLEFSRRALGVKPAVWYGLLTGGLDGRIERFDRDVLRVVPE